MKKTFVSLSASVISIMAYAQPVTLKSDTLSHMEKLGEVVVKGDNIVVTPDKMIVNVDKSVKHHAYDGYSVLSLMSIPGIEVDMFDHNVSAYGKDVLLLINGLEATDDEIKTLNPRDIRRIDYYTNFDPRYPTKEYVLDFVMVIRRSGGVMTTQAEKSLNSNDGGLLVDWRMFRNNTEFGVISDGNIVRTNLYDSRVENFVMRFPTGNTVRTERDLSSHEKKNIGNLKLSLIHRHNNGVFKGAIGLGAIHETENSQSDLSYKRLGQRNIPGLHSSHDDKLNPAMNVSYNHNFTSGIKLSFKLKGNYTHTDLTDNRYQAENYLSYTRENYIYLNPDMNLTMPMGKMVSTYANVNYFYRNSRQHYIENGIDQKIHLINGQAIVEVGANLKLNNNISMTMRLQERIMTTDEGSVRKTDTYFTPGATLSYRFFRSNTLKLGVFSGVYNPELSYYTGGEKRVDDYVMKIGNPNLKIMKPMAINLQWSSAHNWGNVYVNSGYENTSHAIVTDYTLDKDRGVFIESFYNGGHFENLRAQLGTDINLLPDRLRLSASVDYEYSRLPGRISRSMGGFYCGGSIVYMQGGFSGKLQAISQHSFMTRMGGFVREPLNLYIQLGYTLCDWQFNLSALNPFVKVHGKSWSDYDDIFINSVTDFRKLRYDRFTFKVTYRFDYGKRHKFEDVKIDSTPKSAIL